MRFSSTSSIIEKRQNTVLLYLWKYNSRRPRSTGCTWSTATQESILSFSLYQMSIGNLNGKKNRWMKGGLCMKEFNLILIVEEQVSWFIWNHNINDCEYVWVRGSLSRAHPQEKCKFRTWIALNSGDSYARVTSPGIRMSTSQDKICLSRSTYILLLESILLPVQNADNTNKLSLQVHSPTFSSSPLNNLLDSSFMIAFGYIVSSSWITCAWLYRQSYYYILENSR